MDFVTERIAAALRRSTECNSEDIGTVFKEELVALRVARADGNTAMNRTA